MDEMQQAERPVEPAVTALLVCDLQNDFIHPDGAYARGGLRADALAVLPALIAPAAACLRAAGGIAIGTRFTLVPGRGGEPMISAHLRRARPFLRRGDFQPGSWGSTTVDALQPLDAEVEKVAFSAFYMSRLEWVLLRFGIGRVVVCGMLTSGGVASTVRDAHVRDFDVTVLEDACGDFSAAEHEIAIESLRKVAAATSTAGFIESLSSATATATSR